MSYKKIQTLIQLSAVPRFGPARLNQLFDYLDSVETSFELLLEYEQADLVLLAGFSDIQAGAFVNAQSEAQRVIENLSLDRIEVVSRQDATWPAKLRMQDSPKIMPWLFITGNSASLSHPAVGIGGSRDASELALLATRNVVTGLLKYNKTIVSGGARGIDSAAHQTAINEGGQTIIVLAQSIDTWKIPAGWLEAVEAGTATVVSEFAPNTSWGAFRAMQRNQTVLGLSDAFFIAQSGLSGGTFEAGIAAIKLEMPITIARYIGEEDDSYEGNEALIKKGGSPLSVNSPSGVIAEEDISSVFRSPFKEETSQLHLF